MDGTTIAWLGIAGYLLIILLHAVYQWWLAKGDFDFYTQGSWFGPGHVVALHEGYTVRVLSAWPSGNNTRYRVRPITKQRLWKGRI